MSHRGRKNADSALILALASGITAKEAAERAGVSARTVDRRLKDQDFTQAVQAARRSLADSALGMMTAALTDAVKTLKELLTDKAGTVRLGAARSLIELAVRLRENCELEERIIALEAQRSKQW